MVPCFGAATRYIWVAGLSLTVLLSGLQSAFAGGKIDIGEDSWISIGAGARAGYRYVKAEKRRPNGSSASNDFDIQSVRLYVNGQAYKNTYFTFNAVCEGCIAGPDNDADIHVLDAIAQFEFSPEFNLWIGRMLTPADRIEMNGPYYGLSWNQYTVPLLPSDNAGGGAPKRAGFLGRDDGITVWGTLDKFQYAVGAFDGVDSGPNQEDNILWAGRFAYNFLTMEKNPAYYTSSTYYGGGGDIFTVALSAQHQNDGVGIAGDSDDFGAVIVDALFEKVLAGNTVLTLEGEYKMFDADLPATVRANERTNNCFCLFDGDAYFVTAGYLFAKRFQPYVRYTNNKPDIEGEDDSSLTELGVNYIIKGHNLRFNLNYTTGTASLTGKRGSSSKAVFFGVQIQI